MLKLRRIAIDTYRENVAFLSRRCPLYRAEDFQALAKIEVNCGGRRILATLNIVDDDAILGPDQLGLSEQSFRHLDQAEGAAVTIEHATPPDSMDLVRAKIQGRELDAAAFAAIVRDIADHRYSRMEIAAFLIACAGFMTTDEVLGLTRAMAGIGARLDWGQPLVVDKHCIGGIPGNRTSMIVVPIVAAHGLTIPKTSSRAITSPAGTADTMEALARVDIGLDEMRDIVRRTNGCLVWGGRVNLSPADDILISVERPLSVDTREQMVASIMSKKLAAGSTHLVIDIPVGPSAKVRSEGEAARLRKLFEFIGDSLGLQLDVVATDGRQPIGRGIGPILEARDVLRVLRNAAEAPADLRDRALFLAGRIIEFDPAVRGGKGLQRARELLESGAALAAMERIVAAQGACGIPLEPAPLTFDALAERDGTVTAIDCLRLSRIARLAGAPADKGAGIDLYRRIGDPVERGEPLYRIHAAFPADFRFAVAFAGKSHGYTIEGVA